MEGFYKIGKIGRPHGICGEVLLMFSDDVFDTTDADCLMLMIDGLLVPFFIEEYRFKSDETAIMKFEGVSTKEQAQALTHCEVWFPREAAEEGGHYSWEQLVGYEIAHHALTITAIDTSTINHLFVVATAAGDELLIPIVEDWITDIDHSQRRIYMTLPEGIIDL